MIVFMSLPIGSAGGTGCGVREKVRESLSSPLSPKGAIAADYRGAGIFDDVGGGQEVARGISSREEGG